jgi:hypothetical protein
MEQAHMKKMQEDALASHDNPITYKHSNKDKYDTGHIHK